MTIVARGEEIVLEQIVKQLNKLIDVIKVVDMHGETFLERELALVKVNAVGKSMEEIMNIVNIFRAKVLDVSQDFFIVELSGTDEKVNSFIDMMRSYGIKEMTRTGTIAMTRSKKNKNTIRKEK